MWNYRNWHDNSKARSTKTRIETTDFASEAVRKNLIRKQDPLKQGLKLCVRAARRFGKSYSKARSTKTRIETNRRWQRIII